MQQGCKIAVLGVGTMGRALAAGLLRGDKSVAADLRGSVRHEERARMLSGELGFPVGTDNAAAAREAQVLLLCVKPRLAVGVLQELGEAQALAHRPLLISIAAGLSTRRLEEGAGLELPVVRAMPNTPCLIGEGMTVLSPGRFASDEHLETATRIFQPLGRVLCLDEEHQNTVTGLSASGPAFVYVIIESLAEGGVMMGLPRKVATELACQTVQGAARMVLETGRHPAELKDEVTTPAGCTISALLALEDGKLRSVLARGVEQAARAAAELCDN